MKVKEKLHENPSAHANDPEKAEQNFYIGWQEKAQQNVRRFLRPRIHLLFAGSLAIVTIALTLQKPFNDHLFEFSNLTSYTGVYYDLPLPVLVLTEPDDLREQFPTLVLVAVGKFGAEQVMRQIEKNSGQSLNGNLITLKGKLIYGDAHALLELADADSQGAVFGNNNPATSIAGAGAGLDGDTNVSSIVNVKDSIPYPKNPNEWDSLIEKVQTSRPSSITGEILDPKCYFGVMKPGDGLLHKSCAIRCISGGIPAVLRVAVPSAHSEPSYSYFILLDKDGQLLNEEILPYVAEVSRMSGHIVKMRGWNFMLVDNPKQILIVY